MVAIVQYVFPRVGEQQQNEEGREIHKKSKKASRNRKNKEEDAVKSTCTHLQGVRSESIKKRNLPNAESGTRRGGCARENWGGALANNGGFPGGIRNMSGHEESEGAVAKKSISPKTKVSIDAC